MIDPPTHQLLERSVAEVIFRCPVAYAGEWHEVDID
jgi:hypothetical protein